MVLRFSDSDWKYTTSFPGSTVFRGQIMGLLNLHNHMSQLFIKNLHISISMSIFRGFPGGASGKELACQCRRHKRCQFDHWVGKILWRRECQSTPLFFPGESLWTEEPSGLQSIWLQRVRRDWSDLACKRLYLRIHRCPTSSIYLEKIEKNSIFLYIETYRI